MSCQFFELNALLKKSKQGIASAKAGLVRSRPVSAPDLARYSSRASSITTVKAAQVDSAQSVTPSADLLCERFSLFYLFNCEIFFVPFSALGRVISEFCINRRSMRFSYIW